MTHSSKKHAMPKVGKLLRLMDSDPRGHILAAALPGVIATAIRGWQNGRLMELSLEGCAALMLDQAAGAVLEAIESNGLDK